MDFGVYDKLFAMDRTVQTYDQAAERLAADMGTIGPRVADIERALALAKAGPGARVVEVGCGDGRDAVDIVPRVAWYQGFDPSKGLLALAHKRLPDAP